MFDRLPADAAAMDLHVLCNFDNGVIRSPRPVTFLTRAEADGFSLRIVPRAGAPLTQAPMAQSRAARWRRHRRRRRLRRPCAAAIPSSGSGRRRSRCRRPPPPAFTRHGEYAALRAYEAQELAIRRGDPMWQLAYGRAAMAERFAASALRNETSWYHGGDRMIATDLDAKVSFMPRHGLGRRRQMDQRPWREYAAGERQSRQHHPTISSPARRALPLNWAATANSSCRPWAAMT